jgi:hypothetical protein
MDCRHHPDWRKVKSKAFQKLSAWQLNLHTTPAKVARAAYKTEAGRFCKAQLLFLSPGAGFWTALKSEYLWEPEFSTFIGTFVSVIAR